MGTTNQIDVTVNERRERDIKGGPATAELSFRENTFLYPPVRGPQTLLTLVLSNESSGREERISLTKKISNITDYFSTGVAQPPFC
jgi:hypothetical protein